MFGIICILISFLCIGGHVGIRKIRQRPPVKGEVVDICLLYAMIFWVGMIGVVFGFIPHVFFADATAERIGWVTGSPFQFEVGVHDGAWGILGFLCIWFKGGFRAATGLGWGLFMLGAAGGHVYHSVVHGNFAEYNYLMIFVDGFIAFALFLLIYLDWKWNRFSLKR